MIPWLILINANDNSAMSISFPAKLDTIAAGNVIFKTIFEITVKSPSLKKLIFLSTYPNMMIAIKHPARPKISCISSLFSTFQSYMLILYFIITPSSCTEELLYPFVLFRTNKYDIISLINHT